MDKLKMDFVTTNSSQGELADYFKGSKQLNTGKMRPYLGKDGKSYITTFSGGDPKNIKNYKVVPIQTNATLRRDEWKHLDNAVLKVSEAKLKGIQDLIENGLTYDLENAMGTTILESHTMSDAMQAELSMDAITRSQGDRPNFETEYLPIPIIHVDYQINSRVLEASRSLGNPLDITSAERAARKVSEKLEEMLFTSTTYSYGGGNIYSYLTEPNRNQVSLGTAWSSDTASNILSDVYNMKQASIDAEYFGPWVLYVPTGYEVTLDKDYDSTTPGTTIRERILKIAGIEDVKVISTLPADNVLLVQMTSDVVRLVRGMGIQNIEWKSEGNMVTKYKVMTIQVPQVRSDQEDKSGVVHLS